MIHSNFIQKNLFIFSIIFLPVFLYAQTTPSVDTDLPHSSLGCITFTKTLRYQMNDPQVAILQNYLIEEKLLSVVPSTYFGRYTLAAVKKFQAKNGIAQTGTVGRLTSGVIHEDTCAEVGDEEEIVSTPKPTPTIPSTPSITPRPTPTRTPIPTPSSTPTPKISITPGVQPEPRITPTPSVTPTPTQNPSQTPAPTPALTPTSTPTPSPTPTPTPVSILENKTYRIAMVQVADPETDIDNSNICVSLSPAFLPNGRPDPLLKNAGGISNPIIGDCQTDFEKKQTFHTPDDIAYQKLFRNDSYPLKNFLSGPVSYFDMLNIRHYTDIGPDGKLIDNVGINPGATLRMYSLRDVGKYWEDVLKKHGIDQVTPASGTLTLNGVRYSGLPSKLGKNPHFDVTFLPLIRRSESLLGTPTQYDHAVVKKFFNDAVLSSNTDLSSYDYVVYILYGKVQFNKQFDSFATGDKKAYVSLQTAIGRLGNSHFLSVVHEMGHMLFGLADLYSGFNAKYPEGVPDPLHFPQRYGCIMASGGSSAIGLSKSADGKTVSSYHSYNTPGVVSQFGLNPFFSFDPGSHILCVDDLVRITGVENPQCPIADFNKGLCGESCTSLNYYSGSCKK